MQVGADRGTGMLRSLQSKMAGEEDGNRFDVKSAFFVKAHL